MNVRAPGVIVFDMDGVLVDVSESYREAIRQTVWHFTGETVSHDVIQDFKNAGGWNNDWLLSHRLISDLGRNVEYSDVVDHFNLVFLGKDGDGLIRREKWVPAEGTLERLVQKVKLSIFTGRAKYEADATLGAHARGIVFDPLVTDDSVARPKPAPDGLELIKQRFPREQIWFLGDTVDDAASARSSGVAFVGVSMKSNPRHEEISRTLWDGGAFAVIESVNELETLVGKAV